MPRRTDDSRLIRFIHQKAEEHLDESQHSRAPEGCAETADVEAANETRSELKDEGIDDEQEEAQRQDGQRQCHQLEKQAKGCVEQAEYKCRYQRRAERIHMKAGHYAGNNEQGYCAEQPACEQSNHSWVSVFVLYLRSAGAILLRHSNVSAHRSWQELRPREG